MIKQAMILAAGKGVRMQPLTLTTPKPLLKVAGKPLIYWHIERLAAAGIQDIAINAGYLGDMLIQDLQAQDFGVALHLCDEGDEPLETAGGIKNALNKGALCQDDFLLINGDVWTDIPLSLLVDCELSNSVLAHLVLTDNPKHNPLGDFAFDGSKVVSDERYACYTFAGISVLSARLFDEVVGVCPLAPILRQAIQKGQVTGRLMGDCHWVDVGTPERLEELERWILKKTHKYSY